MKRIILGILLTLLSFPAFGRAVSETDLNNHFRQRHQQPAEAPQPAPEQAAFELILLHTNDHHGTILPRGGQGGLAERAAIVNALRENFPNVLLLDAGDLNTGTALSNMFDAEPDILAYNMMGYDAMVFGNHEFSGDFERLLHQIELAEFAFLSSNIRTEDGGYLGVPYLVKSYDGFKVGVFGITTLRTLVIGKPDPSLTFINEIEAAKEMVDILRNREQVDIVIALTHVGNVRESADHVTVADLAAAVAGIDVIVDGHSHSLYETAANVDGVYMVSAGEWGRHIGAGRLSIADGRLAGFQWMTVPVGPEADPAAAAEWLGVSLHPLAPDAEILALLEPFIAEADESLKEVIGEAAETFIFGNRLTRYQETALGNAICDANVWFFRTRTAHDIDFAFHNGGNIRAELPAGPITREQILTILPFSNNIFVASLKGSDVIELFEFIAAIPQGAGGFAQVSSEVRYTIDYTDGVGRLRDLTIHGEPVDPDGIYRFATNDYLLGGGDGYAILARAEDIFNSSLLLSYIFMEAIIAAGGPIVPETDGRITVIADEE